MRALILLAHGSRHPQTSLEVAELADGMRRAAAPPVVAHAFLEIARPDRGQAVAQAVAAGCRLIDVLPLFLNTGNHVVRDIPELVRQARGHHPEVGIRLLRHLGAHPDYAALVETIAREPEGFLNEG